MKGVFNTAAEEQSIALMSAVLGGELDKAALNNADWAEIFAELKAQTTAAMPIDLAAEMKGEIPPEVFNAWLMYAMKTVAFGENILKAQQDMTGLLVQNGIVPCILKGAAAAVNYPNPSYRSMGDIDFLVDEEQLDRALEILLANGYELAFPIDHIDYHVTLKKGKIMFEIHREPAGICDGEGGEALRRIFRKSASQGVLTEVNGYTFYRLPRLHNGLVLLLHIVKHLDDGLGLRQIFDWLAFVQNEVSGEVWEKELAPVLRESGLETLALTVTKTGRIYLGLGGDTAWCESADDAACAELMRFVLDNGNFGRKSALNRRSNTLVGDAHSAHRSRLGAVLSGLQRGGENQWGAVKRFPALKCVAWAYVPVRYVGKLLTGKRTLAETRAMLSAAEKRGSLRDKLAVYDTE